jgi:hypothetical protein
MFWVGKAELALKEYVLVCEAVGLTCESGELLEVNLEAGLVSRFGEDPEQATQCLVHLRYQSDRLS